MFWTLTLNGVLDHVYAVPEVVSDAAIAERSVHLAAGKGINVSRALSELGHRSVAVVVCGNDTASSYRAELGSLGVVPRLVIGLPQTRQHVTILRPRTPLHIRERGLEAVAGTPARIEIALDDVASGDDVAFCGSAADGLPPEFLLRLIRSLRSRGARVWVDMSGEPLRTALRAGAYGIKVNAAEMGEATGEPIGDYRTAAAVARRLLSAGVTLCCLTLGKSGLVLGYHGQVVHAPAPSVPSVSAVGSGDAVLAALLARRCQGDSAVGMAAAGAAAGAANAVTTRPGQLDLTLYRALRESTAPLVRQA